MSKKRRTKREKIIAEYRRKLAVTNNLTPQPTFTSRKTSQTEYASSPLFPQLHTHTTFSSKMPPKDYSYVTQHMLRTLIITSIILVSNVAAFLLIEMKIIKLSFLGL